MLLSTLWIFVTLNYLYCDLIGMMDANLLNQFLTGKVEGIEMNQEFLLGAGILMEIPMAMVLLSRILPYRSNRITNLIAAFIKTAVMIATLAMGSSTIDYWFFACIEIPTTSIIFVLAWRWQENQVKEESADWKALQDSRT